jgi:hypothetical protein
MALHLAALDWPPRSWERLFLPLRCRDYPTRAMGLAAWLPYRAARRHATRFWACPAANGGAQEQKSVAKWRAHHCHVDSSFLP